MIDEINVAIIGLGRVGSTFTKKLYGFKEKGINITAVFERNINAPGLRYAKRLGVHICAHEDEITQMTESVDVIFNLTGDINMETKMRAAQTKLGNRHTVIVSTLMASFIWKMIAEEKLPEHSKSH
ncbi:MAG: hypothetical protein OEV42_09900 [Deltaproteobacteria bacterium]|nr:hypothetical protein [Deltaproteobacteria bacterium]